MRKVFAATIAMGAALALGGCDLFSQGGDDTAANAEKGAQRDQAQPAALRAGAFEGALTAVGGDGNWKLFLNPATGAMLDQSSTGEILRATYAPPIEADGGVVFAVSPMTVAVSPGPCTAGAPGVRYPFNARIAMPDGSVLIGCMYRPWTTQMVALAPAVKACLAVNPGNSGVSYAAQHDDGTVLVRVFGETGAEVDCRAPLTAGAQPITAPADGTVTYPGERDALFYPAPGENPGGECYTAPEVKDASGAVIGWLADPAGC